MQKNLRSETLIYGVGKYASILLTLLTTSILSRLLTPQEYGVVAVTTVFTAFFTVIADLGIGTAIIQNKDLTDSEINDIFSFTVYTAVLLAILFALLGFPASVFYKNPIYKRIFSLLSIAILFTSLNIVPHGMLMRHKRFKLMGIRLTCTAICTGASAIAMACTGFGCYALVFQTILNAAFIFCWNMWNSRLRFHPRFHFSSIRKIFTYSSNKVAHSLLSYFEGNFDNLLISKTLGSVSLAYYDKGYRLMMYPVQNLTHVITPILHPVFSDYQSDRCFIYDAYLKVVRVLSLMGVYIASVCFFAGEEIILFFFGDQWQASVPLFRVLALSVWPQMLSASTNAIYQSTGNTRLMLRSGLTHSAAALALIGVGVATGDLYTAACFVAASLYLRFFIDYYFLVVRNFGYSYAGFLKTFAKDVLIVLLMFAAIAAAPPMTGVGSFLRLVIKAAILLAVFAAGVVVTGQHRFLRALFKKRASH